jgi:hypothetical protein
MICSILDAKLTGDVVGEFENGSSISGELHEDLFATVSGFPACNQARQGHSRVLT